MALGNNKFCLGESMLKFLCKHGYNGVFRAEVIPIDQIDAEFTCLQKNTVFHIRSYKGIAAGRPGAEKIASAGAAEHGNVFCRPAGIEITKAVCFQLILADRKKNIQRYWLLKLSFPAAAFFVKRSLIPRAEK